MRRLIQLAGLGFVAVLLTGCMPFSLPLPF